MQLSRFGRWRAIAVAFSLMISLLAFGAGGVAGADDGVGPADFTLTLLHNNDGESQLIDLGADLEDFGGAARFVSLLRKAKRMSMGPDRGVVVVSSGDNFLAGPEFNASLTSGIFYDAITLDLIDYDAIAIGNHDFDFGPDVFEDFINAFMFTSPPYVSSNLDFSGEPGLQALVDSGRIVESTVVEKEGRLIGIVGATTPNLPFISSPRNVVVDPDVAANIQEEIDELTASGVGIIVVISHLQSIEEDLELAPMLSGVDIMVAGGGDELLANDGDLLVPGDEGEVFGSYPLFGVNAEGADVPIVTTSGQYGYLGRLVAHFDADGDLVGVDEVSGPLRVSGVEPDAVAANRKVQRFVVDPVVAALEDLANNVIGTSEVGLNGIRGDVRTIETNEGNLIADALKWQAEQLAADFGVQVPDVAFQNGGGIRNDSIIPAGDITELDTFDMVPFPNFVTVFEDLPAEQIKDILENAVSRVESVSGRFAQVSGLSFTWDAARDPRTYDEFGNVTFAGDRVVEVVLDDGTVLVEDGAVVAGAPAVTVATIDFLARGGDQYPFGDEPFTVLGVTYQQALRDYIIEGLGGLISAADYPEGGEGRITRLN